MREHVPTQPIDRLSAADSVLSLLAALRGEKISPAERMAVANLQIETTEEWLSAYMQIEAASAKKP